jgi:hypothetical protein
MVDAVEDDAVAVRLAYHYSKALTKCEGLKTLFAHFLRFKDLTAIWGKQPSLWVAETRRSKAGRRCAGIKGKRLAIV